MDEPDNNSALIEPNLKNDVLNAEEVEENNRQNGVMTKLRGYVRSDHIDIIMKVL
jgi:hypothetical protein